MEARCWKYEKNYDGCKALSEVNRFSVLVDFKCVCFIYFWGHKRGNHYVIDKWEHLHWTVGWLVNQIMYVIVVALAASL